MREYHKIETLFERDEKTKKLNEYKPYQFIDTICDVCKDYGFSISHEDSHGSFIIEKYNDTNIDRFRNANVDLK